MGKVDLAGAFAGSDVASNSSSSSVTFDFSTASLLARSADGSLSKGRFPLSVNGPNGVVRALDCDASQKQMWAGGQFSSLGLLHHAQLFSSPARSMALRNGSLALNSTNNPNVSLPSGATPFSSSLIPVPLENASVDAGPSSSDSQFSNAQNILCPAGADGPGKTWLAVDGNNLKAVITVRKFPFLTALAIRLGNTCFNGRGTTGFSAATIPDHAVQHLNFTRPDFLFNGDKDITGFQLTLSKWRGSGPGLHLLQLLSSGAMATLFRSSPTNTSRTGDWKEADAVTTDPGTTQAFLVSIVKVGTPSNDALNFTWMPYVSASGEYDVKLLEPGCTDFLRTTVKRTVFPGGGQQPWVTIVSQQNTADAAQIIYRGPVVPTPPSFEMTVTLTFADDPASNGQNGEYEPVADRVQSVLTSPSVTSSGNSSSVGGNSTAAAERGFGFLDSEWPLSGSSSTTSAS
ncbi:hypothetical protein FKP32DRAFT_1608715 [Trametes sanguinea]|nr:hypothetical protein FKP32DRAFT_1608715 [Trametes sanguinea]